MNIGLFSLKFFALIRAFVYLYITVEASLLGYMYWNAYRKYKTTPIIHAVQILLFSIGFSFFYMCLLAMVSFIDNNSPLYDLLIALVPIFTLPLLYAINNFRCRSTEEINKDGHNLPKSYKFKK